MIKEMLSERKGDDTAGQYARVGSSKCHLFRFGLGRALERGSTLATLNQPGCHTNYFRGL